MRRKLRSVGLGFLILTLFTASGCSQRGTIWIYSSMRNVSQEALEHAFASKFPSADVKWYVAGSEKLAQTLDADHAVGNDRADLVISADPFWYYANKQGGLFRPYRSPADRSTLKALGSDPDHNFVAIRIMSVALARNPAKVSLADAPRSWKDLTLPKWKGKIAIPNPLESGTMFAFISVIAKAYGPSYLESLKANDLAVTTTSDSVVARLQSGDRPIAIMLLEDALRSKKAGISIEPILPEDGAIAIPGYVAILKSTKSPAFAEKAYDFLLSAEAQRLFVEHGMYSPLDLAAVPPGGNPWTSVHWQNLDWSGDWLSGIVSAREVIKKNFSNLFFRP